MVVLDLGTHRVTVPETYVEIQDGAAPSTPIPPLRTSVSSPRRRWRRVALAVGLPLGVLALATVRLLVSDPR